MLQHSFEVTPDYLNDLIPGTHKENTYNLRSRGALPILRCRLEIYRRSFLPSTVLLWNSLPHQIINSVTLSSFKVSLKAHLHPDNNKKLKKKLYCFGNRAINCTYAKLRIGCSALSDHLFRNIHVIDSPKCHCGAPREDVDHYFIMCPTYSNHRNILLRDRSSASRYSYDIKNFTKW